MDAYILSYLPATGSSGVDWVGVSVMTSSQPHPPTPPKQIPRQMSVVI